MAYKVGLEIDWLFRRGNTKRMGLSKSSLVSALTKKATFMWLNLALKNTVVKAKAVTLDFWYSQNEKNPKKGP